MPFAALIVDCFRHALDRKLFWVMIAISTFIAVVMACIGIDENETSLFFGMWTFDGAMGRAVAAGILTKYIGALYIGWIGVILALIATAGIIPSFMERGSIDVVLAKPISRPMLFLGKYLGGMAFMTVQAAFFVIITFLVVGLRWHFWLWGYFWSIPLMILLFSYVYAFCALFGVMTRSALAALLLTMLAWIAIWVLQSVYSIAISPNPFDPESKTMLSEEWIKASKVVRTIVPKTQDIPTIAGSLMQAASAAELIPDMNDPNVPDDVERQLKEAQMEAARKLEDVNIATSIGSSLLFESVIILLAMWKFSRRDF